MNLWPNQVDQAPVCTCRDNVRGKMEDRLYEDIETAKYYQLYRPDYKQTDIQGNVIPFLREKLKVTPDSLAVDVGCGTGQLTRCLAPLFSRVIGVDISKAQITVAKEFTSEENIEYRVSPAEDLSFLSSESVDLVSAATAYHYFDGEPFLKEVDRILRPGGCLLTLYSRVPSTYYSMVPDTTNEDTIAQCRSLMDEVSGIISDILGSRASKRCTTGQYPFPNYQEKYKFPTTIWKPLTGLHGFAGLLNTLGGIEKYGKDNPGKENKQNVIETLTKKLENILREITSTPETFQLYLTADFEGHLYRKPCKS